MEENEMFCRFCGSEIDEGVNYCAKCKNSIKNGINEHGGENKRVINRNRFLTFCTIVLIVAFFIFLILGFTKMSDTTKYVGGDAYNYIINAGKATAFFVLAFGSFISGIIIEILNCYKGMAIIVTKDKS